MSATLRYLGWISSAFVAGFIADRALVAFTGQRVVHAGAIDERDRAINECAALRAASGAELTQERDRRHVCELEAAGLRADLALGGERAKRAADELLACVANREELETKVDAGKSQFAQMTVDHKDSTGKAATDLATLRKALDQCQSEAGPYRAALEELKRAPRSGFAYYGESENGSMLGATFILCTENGTPLEDANGVPEEGNYARSTWFVNVHSGFPEFRLGNGEWIPAPMTAAFEPGRVVHVDDIKSISGGYTWIHYSIVK